MKKGKSNGNRIQRLDSEFRKLIYEIIKDKLSLKDVTEMFTITEVVTTPDLKHAKVYLSVYSTDKEKKEKTFNAIVKAAPTIRYELGSEMTIRTVPELHFVEDTTFDYGNKIDMLLSKLTYGDNDESKGN